MSRKPKTAPENVNENLGRKFRIYVKTVDEFGFPDESGFGWISKTDKNQIVLRTLYENAIIFEEKEHGHGSFEDWKEFFESEHGDWRIENGPCYLTEL